MTAKLNITIFKGILSTQDIRPKFDENPSRCNKVKTDSLLTFISDCLLAVRKTEDYINK